VWTRNFLTDGNMEYFERQIDGPCHKLEACIWNSHSQFGAWKTLNYSSEDKESNGIFVKSLSHYAEYHCAKWIIAKSPARKENPVVFTTGILQLPNHFLIIFHLILHNPSFFIRTKVLMFCSAAEGMFAKLWKTPVSFCLVSPKGTSRIHDPLS
jgi:hypothetical protein